MNELLEALSEVVSKYFDVFSQQREGSVLWYAEFGPHLFCCEIEIRDEEDEKVELQIYFAKKPDRCPTDFAHVDRTEFYWLVNAIQSEVEWGKLKLASASSGDSVFLVLSRTEYVEWSGEGESIWLTDMCDRLLHEAMFIAPVLSDAASGHTLTSEELKFYFSDKFSGEA